MTLPAFDYGNPANVAQGREALEVTCAGCMFHQRSPDRIRFRCAMDNPLYPNATNRRTIEDAEGQKMPNPSYCGLWTRPVRARPVKANNNEERGE